jgi:L-asparaginase
VKFDQIKKEVPELNKFNYNIQTIIFNPALDSSNVTPATWVKIATTIKIIMNYLMDL